VSHPHISGNAQTLTAIRQSMEFAVQSSSIGGSTFTDWEISAIAGLAATNGTGGAIEREEKAIIAQAWREFGYAHASQGARHYYEIAVGNGAFLPAF
jgi:hypothetical protein